MKVKSTFTQLVRSKRSLRRNQNMIRFSSHSAVIYCTQSSTTLDKVVFFEFPQILPLKVRGGLRFKNNYFFLFDPSFDPINLLTPLDVKLVVIFGVMRVNNFGPLVKKMKNRKLQSASSKIRETRTQRDSNRSEKQELSSAKRSAGRKRQISIRDLQTTRNKV